jgi:alkaline phosphatase
VMLGGGRQYFDQKVKAGTYRGKTVFDQARARGYRVVGTATGLSSASASKPLLGVFAKNELDLAWVGPKPTRTGTRLSRCHTNTKRSAAQPTLATMASKAIALLDERTRNADKGFFLQIEGASIDKQDHAANPCGQIGETVRFDAAVKVALAYQKQHPETLVVVTADHGHTSQIVDAGTTTMGYTATLLTADGAQMTVSYATAKISQRQQHTGTEVRIAAVGPSAGRVEGVTDQTDLFRTFKAALGL